MLQIRGTGVKILGKLCAVLEIKKNNSSNLVLGCYKGRFKVLHFTNTNISFTLPPSLQYATIQFSRVRKLSEFKITGVYSRKAVQRKTRKNEKVMTKKLYSLLLLMTPIKKVHALQKFMLVSITFVAITHEEMLKKDFVPKYFFPVKAVAIRTNPPSMINHMLPTLFLELVIIYP